MMRLLSAAVRGVKAELAAGQSGWIAITSAGTPLSTAGTMSDAGAMVSADTAMRLSTVWACVSTTAQQVASLPCHLYERDRNGHAARVEDELATIAFHQPNPVQTGVELWEGLTAQTLLRGNGYARKLRHPNGSVIGLQPILSTTPRWIGHEFEYHIADRGKSEILPASEVLHLRGFGSGDGLGLSVVKYGVQSLGAALAADQSAAKVFSNAMMPSGVLKADQKLRPEQRAQLQEMLAAYAGSTRAGKILTLEAGLSFDKVQWDPEDVQLLQTRRFQVEDICRWFGMPPIVIGHSPDGQTMWGTGVESIMRAWLQTGLNPILTRIEQRLNRDLLPPAMRTRRFFRYDRQALLQMDSKSLAEFLSRMATSGTMTGNERRDFMGLPRHDDPMADALLAQTALAPLQDLGRNETS